MLFSLVVMPNAFAASVDLVRASLAIAAVPVPRHLPATLSPFTETVKDRYRFDLTCFLHALNRSYLVRFAIRPSVQRSPLGFLLQARLPAILALSLH